MTLLGEEEDISLSPSRVRCYGTWFGLNNELSAWLEGSHAEASCGAFLHVLPSASPVADPSSLWMWSQCMWGGRKLTLFGHNSSASGAL